MSKASGANPARKNKRLLQALRGERPDHVPVWLMRQAGRYLPEYRATRGKAGGFLNLCYTPALAEEVTLQPIRRFGFDASILFSDILVVPDALGQKVAFQEGEGPVLEPFTDLKALGKLDLTKIRSHLAPVYETVERLSKSLPAETTLIGFAGAPWTVATYMVGGRGSPDQGAAKAWAYRAPDEFQVLIDLLVEATIEHLSAQIEAGAEVIQIFDTWAGSLPPLSFERFALQPVKKIWAALLAKFPDVPVIAFPRGAGAQMVNYFKETGISAISMDTGVSPAWAREALQPLGCVQGNLDPLLLVAGGPEMRAQAEMILATLSGGPFIFNLGHGIVPQTPPEHVAELVKLVQEWKS
ncbi:MAG: uroporphyrinogen decarboxylase [Rhizobiales bacterium]|nr:uroporphyrinogen decarboxylase [Hyphomicrobiales bacterium]